MSKAKRAISYIVTLLMLFVLTCSIASANVQSSDYLSSYAVKLSAGNSRGALVVSFDVSATKISDYVGISQIVFYRSDGTYITTITGTTGNGLLNANKMTAMSDYTHYGVSGNSYYAVVTVYAEYGGGSDSRDITTAIVRAP